jgi:hypothetical protein
VAAPDPPMPSCRLTNSTVILNIGSCGASATADRLLVISNKRSPIAKRLIHR